MTLDPNAELWELPIIGFEVLEVWFSGELHVIAYGDGGDVKRRLPAPQTQITLGGAFILHAPAERVHHLSGQDPWESLVPILALRHARITGATADRTSTLHLHFDDGHEISAGPDPQYENWQINAPDRLHLVAMPGRGDPRIRG
jgi:hypothetical protein